MAESFDVAIEKDIEDTARTQVQLALRTKMTGALIIHIEASAEDMIALRNKVQATLKYYKAALIRTLSTDQQTLTPSGLLHDVFASKVAACLKLR